MYHIIIDYIPCISLIWNLEFECVEIRSYKEIHSYTEMIERSRSKTCLTKKMNLGNPKYQSEGKVNTSQVDSCNIYIFEKKVLLFLC